MRTLPACLAAALVLLPLAGCGQGSAFDEAFRNSYREKGVQTCATQARTAMAQSGRAAPAGVDFDRICACAVDRIMAGKSARELMSPPDDATQRAAVEQCAAQAVSGGGKP